MILHCATLVRETCDTVQKNEIMLSQPHLKWSVRLNMVLYERRGYPMGYYTLHVELTHVARPVKVKLRYYSPSQRAFMKKVMNELIYHGIMYHNPSSS